MIKDIWAYDYISSPDAAGTELEALQKDLGYHFRAWERLELALTHSSLANEANRPDSHNERLEFLGDAVLELCVSTELFQKFPEAREGELTRMRATLVNARALAELAKKIGIPALLKLGKGEDKQGGRERESILSDALEAVLGAIYLDGGFLAARQTVKLLYQGLWPDKSQESKELDDKSRLQELSQNMYQALPVYSLEAREGPPHAPRFLVSLRLPDGRVFTAEDSSCKKAEQKAAGRALASLNKDADVQEN